MRHKPKQAPGATNGPAPDLTKAAEGAAALGIRRNQVEGHGQKFAGKQEILIAALLTETNHGAAATKAGVAEMTMYRWMRLPSFRKAYRNALDASSGSVL